MVDSTQNKDKTGGKEKNVKLVKATELPLNGNPYPPKDVVIDETPGVLENKVRTIRLAVQPYTIPVSTAFDRASDIIATGKAHTQSTFLSGSQGYEKISQGLVVFAGGFLGYRLVHRRGFILKFISTVVGANMGLAALNPQAYYEGSQTAWFIALNKLPSFAKQQFNKLTSRETTSPPESSDISMPQSQNP